MLLKKGIDKTLAVVKLQLQLRHLGFYNGLITGEFDDRLETNVKAYQSVKGLTVDGLVGNNTQAILQQETATDWWVLFLHCAASPEGKDWTGDDIALMHLSPKPRSDGKYLFNGKVVSAAYIKSQKILLPSGKVVPATQLLNIGGGRGWSRSGYSDIIRLDGTLESLTEWDQDNKIESNEYTFGVKYSTLLNQNARHICYIGGVSANDIRLAKDTRTPEQLKTMETYIKFSLLRNPNLIIAGHNQVQNKPCPSFEVPDYLRKIGISEYNIANWGKLYS